MYFKANNENDLINKVKEFKKDHSVINVDWDIKNYNTGLECEQLYLADVQYYNQDDWSPSVYNIPTLKEFAKQYGICLRIDDYKKDILVKKTIYYAPEEVMITDEEKILITIQLQSIMPGYNIEFY